MCFGCVGFGTVTYGGDLPYVPADTTAPTMVFGMAGN